MHAFFKSWRRKAGCIALLIACVFSGIWLRSIRTFDEVFIRFGNANYLVSSAQGGFGLLIDEPSNGNPDFAFFSEPIDPPCPQVDTNDVEAPKRGLEAIGFYFGGDPNRSATLIMPYWSIIWPLVILSGYLILCRTRPKPAINPR